MLPLNAKMLLDAIQFANEKHAGQVRKGSGIPYISHPIAVSYLVAAYKSSRHLVALLVPEAFESASGRRYIQARRPELYGKMVEPPADGRRPEIQDARQWFCCAGDSLDRAAHRRSGAGARGARRK